MSTSSLSAPPNAVADPDASSAFRRTAPETGSIPAPVALYEAVPAPRLRHLPASVAGRLDRIRTGRLPERIDLEATPPDIDLVRSQDPSLCLKLGYVPWRQSGGRTIIAVSDPDACGAIEKANPLSRGNLHFALADRAGIEAVIATVFARQLRDRTRDRCPTHLSCREWQRGGSQFRLVAATAIIAALALSHPAAAAIGILAWIWAFDMATTTVRLAALFVFGTKRPRPRGPLKLRKVDLIREGSPHNLLALDKKQRTERPLTGGPLVLSETFLDKAQARLGSLPAAPDLTLAPPRSALPKVSILIPLLREDEVLETLIDALKRTTYPTHLLDVKLVIECDDTLTAQAISALALPSWITVLRVPHDELRTKPRAMNYALEFCSGEIVGIYDAEDRPEPDQIMKIARHFLSAPPEVACLQGYLDFYNPRRNFLSRCFTIDYAIWFRVLLRGMARLGLPIPLGGTTVFFRRGPLEKVGAWDAHNVTEDADLGMRLARFGYRTEVAETVTMEEANCFTRPWITQRSRWLKGFAITWATHMRDPITLWRDLGPGGFFGFQVIFLGALTGFLTAPLLWGFWAVAFGLSLPLDALMPMPVWWLLFGSMAASKMVFWAVAVAALAARERQHLLKYIPLIGFYFPLGTVAAYKALWELLSAPFLWHKTRHGL